MLSIVLPLHFKQIFPPIIRIFTEGEGDEISLNSKFISFFFSLSATRTPFKIFFRTDGNELEFDDLSAVAAQAAKQTAITNEEIAFPGGIIGFSLDFTQPIMC